MKINIKDFQFPERFYEVIPSEMSNKQINQQLIIIQGKLQSDVEEVEKKEYFDFLLSIIANESVNEQIQNNIADLVYNQINKFKQQIQQYKNAEKLTLYLTLFAIYKLEKINNSNKIHLIKNTIQYFQLNQMILRVYELVLQIVLKDIENDWIHILFVQLYQALDQERRQILAQQLSEQKSNPVRLLRKLAGKQIEDYDQSAKNRFDNIWIKDDVEFIENIIIGYIQEVQNMYSKSNRIVLQQMAKYIHNYMCNEKVVTALLKYYNKCAQFIRNTATIILTLLYPNLSEQLQQLITKFLIQRCDDQNVHARSCVYQSLGTLVKQFKDLSNFLIIATDRMRDRGTFARRASIYLFRQILLRYHNIYGLEIFNYDNVNKQYENLTEQRKKIILELKELREQNPTDIQQKQLAQQKLDLLYEDITRLKQSIQTNELQRIMHQQIQKALEQFPKLVMSKNISESVEVLQTYQYLLHFKYEGMIERIKKTLILVHNDEMREKIINQFNSNFLENHQMLIELMETSNLWDLDNIEQIIKHQKPNQNVLDLAWLQFTENKYTVSNLILLRYSGFSQLPNLSQKVLFLKNYIQHTDNFKVLTEIVQIISSLNDEHVSLIFINLITEKLREMSIEDAGWYQCMEQIIRLISQLLQPEFHFQNLFYQFENFHIIPKLFIRNTASFKLFINFDQMIKRFIKKVQSQEITGEFDLIDGNTKDHLEKKQEEIYEFFDQIAFHKLAEIASDICKTFIEDSYRQRIQVFDQVALISLLQFMIISSSGTNNCQRLIANLLEYPLLDRNLKCNVLIAFSDLYQRNYSRCDINSFMKRMEDTDIKVRRVAILINSHLTLLDILKTDIGKLAKHLVDPDEQVRSHAKIFFIQYYKKNPQQMWTLIPELINSLAKDFQVNNEEFKNLAQELFPLIDKDSIIEKLLNKLLDRFEIFQREANIRNSDFLKKTRDGEDIIMYDPTFLNADKEKNFLSICLAQMDYSFNSLQLVVERFLNYKDSLSNKFIFSQFKEIYNKCRKKIGNIQQNQIEYKALLETFKNKLSFYDTTLDTQPKKKTVQKKKVINTQPQESEQESSSMEIE